MATDGSCFYAQEPVTYSGGAEIVSDEFTGIFARQYQALSEWHTRREGLPYVTDSCESPDVLL